MFSSHSAMDTLGSRLTDKQSVFPRSASDEHSAPSPRAADGASDEACAGDASSASKPGQCAIILV